MPPFTGWREVPCVECGEFVLGIEFGQRCPSCFKRRQLRVDSLARRIALAATVIAAAWVLSRIPATPLGRWIAVISVPFTYVLVRAIARRIAMEVL